MEFPSKELLAFSWHAIDGFLITRSHRRTRALWAGIGVGWSLFWIIHYYTEPKKLLATKPWRKYD